MTVKQLIEKLKEFPEDMPVATFDDICWSDIDNPEYIDVAKHTWEDKNPPCLKPSFDYVNLT